MSPLQVATRALVKLLVSLALAYDLTVKVTRDSDDAAKVPFKVFREIVY